MRQKNPSQAQIKSLLDGAGGEPLRWIRDHDGNVYVWPAQQGGHGDAARELGIEWPWRQGLIVSGTDSAGTRPAGAERWVGAE